MSPIEVSICAQGSLPPQEVEELAALGLRERADQVQLHGYVADQAALVGVLERLRRAGMQIRHLSPGGSASGGTERAHIGVAGNVGALLRTVLDDAVVSEADAMTTVTVALTDPDELFEVIRRLGDLGLQLHRVHVGEGLAGQPLGTGAEEETT
jgi:hypothetical protein